MAGLPTFDYEVEGTDLQRRQQILDALQKGSLAPLEVRQVGGMAGKVNPLLEVLGGLAQQYGLRQKNEKLKEDKAALAKRYGDDLRTGMEQFYKTSEGYEAPSLAANPGPDGQPSTTRVPGDPRKAIFDALASNHPVLRELAMSQLKEQGKDKLTPKDLLPYANPESIPAILQKGMTGFSPKRDLKAVAPGEILLDAGGNIAQPGRGLASPTGPGWETAVINGDLYQRTATGLKKLDNAPKISTTVNASPVIQGQKAGMEAWSKKAADTVTDMAESARNSVKLVSQLNQMEALTKGGTAAGPLADAAVFLSGLANQAGLKVDPAKLSNSQTFNSVATQAWAALMQQNGGARGLVKEESEKLAQSLPSLVQTPEGRAQIIAVLKQAATQNISDAQKASKEYAMALRQDDPALFTFGLSTTQLPQSGSTPAAPGSVAGKQPSVTNW